MIAGKIEVATHNKAAMSVEEAAAMVGVCGKHLRDFIASGELVYFRLGNRLLISRDALERFIKTKEAENQTHE